MSPVDRNVSRFWNAQSAWGSLLPSPSAAWRTSTAASRPSSPSTSGSPTTRCCSGWATVGALAAIYTRQLAVLEVDAIDLDACCGWSLSVVEPG